MRKSIFAGLGLSLGVALGLAAVPAPAGAQVVCAKAKKNKTQFKLRDACKPKETLALDLAASATGLESRVAALEGDVDALMAIGTADRCTWMAPFNVQPTDPRGCAPGLSTGDRCTTTTSCDPGEFAAAGACVGDTNTAVAASQPDGTTGWTCELLRTEDVAFVAKFTAGVLCCE